MAWYGAYRAYNHEQHRVITLPLGPCRSEQECHENLSSKQPAKLYGPYSLSNDRNEALRQLQSYVREDSSLSMSGRVRQYLFGRDEPKPEPDRPQRIVGQPSQQSSQRIEMPSVYEEPKRKVKIYRPEPPTGDKGQNVK